MRWGTFKQVFYSSWQMPSSNAIISTKKCNVIFFVVICNVYNLWMHQTMMTINPALTQMVLMRIFNQEHKVVRNVKKKEHTGSHYDFV